MTRTNIIHNGTNNIIYRLGVKIIKKLGSYYARESEYLSLINRILGVYKKQKGYNLTILDLGCGTGHLTSLLALFHNIIGLDLKFFKIWKKRGGNYIVGDARKLPFRNNSLDTILSISLLEHIDKWSNALIEISRVLKIGGIYVLQLPNLKYLIEPHTKFPLLYFFPNILRRVIKMTAKYPELNFTCTIENILHKVNIVNLKLIGTFYYHHQGIPKFLKTVPPSYFLIFIKHKKLLQGIMQNPCKIKSLWNKDT